MTPQEKPDSAELDAIIELQKHPGWALVCQRVSEEIERLRDQLENQPNLVDTRGQIKGLRLALTIPGIRRDEIERSL